MNDPSQSKEDLTEIDLKESNIPITKRKILVLGGQRVGKTAFIKRYKNNTYTKDYEPTIEIITKKITNLNNDYIDLEIIDLEGQTEYTIFSANKYAFGYNAYMLIYDVRDKKSFELIQFIYEQINNLSGKTSKILIGTKSDDDIDESEREVTSKEGKEFADKIHCPFIEISSKDNKNIEEAFRLLLIEINKTESGINLKKLKFYNLFKYFVHHPKSTVCGYYLLLIISFIFNITLPFIGILLEIDNNDNDFGNVFPFIILGIWVIIVIIYGIIGMIKRNSYLLKLNYYGLIFGCIYIIPTIAQIVITWIIEKQNLLNKIKAILVLVIDILLFIPAIAMTYIFKTIYKNNLKSYIS